jgi:hypothetical protein
MTESGILRFVCGGYKTLKRAMTINFGKKSKQLLPNMIMEHSSHALVILENAAYVFGGYIHREDESTPFWNVESENTNASEFYSFTNN